MPSLRPLTLPPNRPLGLIAAWGQVLAFRQKLIAAATFVVAGIFVSIN